jgi:hypothetical protein
MRPKQGRSTTSTCAVGHCRFAPHPAEAGALQAGGLWPNPKRGNMWPCLRKHSARTDGCVRLPCCSNGSVVIAVAIKPVSTSSVDHQGLISRSVMHVWTCCVHLLLQGCDVEAMHKLHRTELRGALAASGTVDCSMIGACTHQGP